MKRFARELEHGGRPSRRRTTRASSASGCTAPARAPTGCVLNPGAWTHYSYAIRDALEVAGLPAVEVHLSAVDEREEWRRMSVIRDLCIGCVQGKGVDGYREALDDAEGARSRRERSGASRRRGAHDRLAACSTSASSTACSSRTW